MIPLIKKILFATDLSQNSFYAFQYAVDLAQRHDAKIIVLHAVEPGPKEVRFVGVLHRIEEKERTEMPEQIRKLIQEFCQKGEAETGLHSVRLYLKFLFPVAIPQKKS